MRPVARAAFLVASWCFAARAAAQRPTLHVLNHVPADSGGSASVVLVTFDHPVAGALDRSVDASRIFRMSPTMRGTLGWRDPATIRFIPEKPLEPGANFRVTIDTGFAAVDGARLAEPFSFSFRVPGPRLLRVAPVIVSDAAYLARDGVISLLFSAPVPDTSIQKLSRGARLELTDCKLQLPLHVVGQHPVEPTTRYELRNAYVNHADTAGVGLRRVVDLAPSSLLPEACSGFVWLPSLDPNAPNDTSRHRVATIPRFQLAEPMCWPDYGCDSRAMIVRFTAPVRRADFLELVTITPAVSFRVTTTEATATEWRLDGLFAPGETYTIHASRDLRDISGRAIVNDSVRHPMGDLHPTLTYRTGMVTTPFANPTVRLRFANVDSAIMVVYAIPDDQRAAWLPGVISPKSKPLLTDSIVRVIALHPTFNVQGDTLIHLPAWPGHQRQLRAVAFSIRTHTPRALKPGEKRNSGWVARYAADDQPHPWPMLVIQTSDIILHSKIDDRRALVLATNGRNGTAVPNAAVTMYDSAGAPIADGRTDATGVADLMLRRGRRFADASSPDRYWWTNWYSGYLEATTPEQRSVSALGSTWTNDELSPWTLGNLQPARSRPAGALFTDRGIYRPGETVHLSAIVRDGVLGALTTPAGDSVRLRIIGRLSGADVADTIFAATSALSEFGTVTDSTHIDERAHLGEYEASVELQRRGQWIDVERRQFRVGEYRAPEFTVTTAAESEATPGDTVRVAIGAQYLFGAPMARANATWALNGVEVPWVAIPGLEGYAVGSVDWSTWQQRRHTIPTQRGVDTLDATGRGRVALVPNLDSLTQPVLLTVEVAITDVNRQVVTSSTQRVVHPSALYIAARDTKRAWSWNVGTPDSLRVLAVRPNGARVAGTRVDVAIIRHDWSYRGDGTHLTSDTVARMAAISDTVPSAVTFTPKLAGNYEVRFTARDETGRLIATSLYEYASGGAVVDPLARGVRLPLMGPSSVLHAGDTATVVYTNPFSAAEAWITVEREGVLEQRRATVAAGTHEIKLAITERHAPSVYLSVLLVNHASVFVDDSLRKGMRIGYTTIRVDTSPKRLAVELLPSTHIAGPSDSITLSIRLRDGTRGTRGEVSLWAADEGVLGLTGFTTPNPLAEIYRERGLGTVFQMSTPTALDIKPPDPLGIRIRGRFGNSLFGSEGVQLNEIVTTGGTSAPIEVSTRSNFRATAFFVGRVVTDDSGRGSTRVKLPDNLTTFRLMAVAVTAGDRYGSADDSLLVTRPVVARPSLPRFVRTGDTLRAGATVNIRGGAAQQATITSTVVGLTMYGAPAAQLMADGHGTEARWRYVVPQSDTAGSEVKFHFAAAAADGADAVEATLPVRAPYVPRTQTLTGVVRGDASVHFDLPADIDPTRSTLSLQLAGSPLGVMGWALRYLRAYPYNCTEQIASNGRAMIALYRARAALSVGPIDSAFAANPVARLQGLVDAISARQNADGGIRYWNADRWSSPWLSANAGQFLLEARPVGVAVDQRVLDGIARYVTSELRDYSFLADTLDGTKADRTTRLRGWLNQRVAAVAFLRSNGTPSVADEDEVMGFAPRMTWEDRVSLVTLMAQRDPALGRRMLDEAWRAVSPGGKRVDFPDSTIGVGAFPSHVRPVARLLQTTYALEPDHPLLGALLETMLQLGRAQRVREMPWAWNTQDYSSAIIAAATISKDQGDAAQRGVSVRTEGGSGRLLLNRGAGGGGASIDSSTSLDGVVRVRGTSVDLPLIVSGGTSTAQLFYALTVTEIPKAPSTTPDQQGLFVERWYERYDNGQPVTSVDEGDLVRVRLRVTATGDRQFVALDDALPAGLEAVDLSLRTSATLGPFAAMSAGSAPVERDRNVSLRAGWGSGGWDQGWWSPWENRELRDDRVVYFARMLWAGTYSVSYVARATTAGVFVRPPARAEEMYNPALHGRTEGGVFTVREKPGGRR